DPISPAANPCCNRVLFGVVPALVKAMRRRDFIKVITGSAVVWPLAASAQQTKVARIGFLGVDSPSSHAARLAALRAGLHDLGWVEGTNLLVEYRWAEGNYEVCAFHPTDRKSTRLNSLTNLVSRLLLAKT